MNDNIFLAGAAREDTTPELGTFLYGYRPDITCKTVHDPLSVTALAVSQNGRIALLLTTEKTNNFAKKCEENGLSIVIPINTGKHIYTNWTQIMEKRGALHPAMDPFRMKENEGLQMDYTMDMCPKTLDYLSRTAYISIDPDWTDEEISKVAEAINNAV